MQARWFASLGRRLLSSARPAFAPSPHRCLRSVALPVDPSIRKPVISDFISAALRDRPPVLGFHTPSPLLPATQSRFYAAKDRSRAPRTPVTSKVKKYKIKSYSGALGVTTVVRFLVCVHGLHGERGLFTVL
ncbi:hypothetical protein BHM03_00004352 [Ensete ventricosum]|nr:hypothetical protein BHM03_00004352 [Ensete ventricosum]